MRRPHRKQRAVAHRRCFEPAAPGPRAPARGWAGTRARFAITRRAALCSSGNASEKVAITGYLFGYSTIRPGLTIDNWFTAGERFYKVSSRKLANGEGGGGNVQLHKPNRSNSAGPGFFELKEWQMCGDMDHP